jgi:hypothetical protein
MAPLRRPLAIVTARHVADVVPDVDEGFPCIALAASPIDPLNPLLYHKTTNRRIYEDAIAARPGSATYFSTTIAVSDRGDDRDDRRQHRRRLMDAADRHWFFFPEPCART